MGPGQITVKWTPPTDNGGDPVTFYTVKWNTNADMMYPGLTPDKDAVQVQAAVTSSYTIEGLTPTQTYYGMGGLPLPPPHPTSPAY
jgi:hypothetical protein